ncbi:MAG TPA: hypothetical protein VM471_09560 [Phenylobacterium sp.]|nr:hypothetical protein [Phenylobacterium sp.]
MSTSFTITDQAELSKLAPFLEAEARKDTANVHYFAAEAARRRSTMFSGSAPMAVVTERSDAERLIAAKAAYAKAQRPEIALRRKLLAALSDLERNNYGHTAQRVRGHYDRDLSDHAAPVCPDAVGRAQIELLSIPSEDVVAGGFVREALAALAGLLVQSVQEAA